MRRCPKCGFLLNENDRYCENCGEDCSAVEDSEVNEVVSPDEEKEKLKRQWKIGGIVFGVVALFLRQYLRWSCLCRIAAVLQIQIQNKKQFNRTDNC